MSASKIKIIFFCLLTILFFSGFAFGYDFYGTSFQYRKDITISSSLIDATLGYFPVLVKLDSTKIDFNHFLHSTNDGYDIRFTDSIDGSGDANGAILDYERERFDKTNEKAEIWVEIPSVSDSADTTFYMFYGNTNCADGEDVNGTWDGGTDASPLNNYIGVWHLCETGSTVYDSTSNSYDGSVTGASPNSSSYIDGGYDFVRDETDRIVMSGTGNALQLTDFTVEVWMITPDSSVAEDYYIVTQSLYTDDNESWALNIADDSGHLNEARFTTKESGTQTRVFGSVVTGNQWHYMAGVRTSTQLLIYIDNSPANSENDNKPGQIIQSSANISVGSAIDVDTEDFNGTADEVRISNIARPAAWIKASYHSGNNSLLTIPTLINLSYFRAKPLDCSVLLEWATETELDNEGFNILKSDEEDGEYVKINRYVIPARGEAGFGAEYSYTDYDVENGVTYYYLLEDIDFHGKSTLCGPVFATPNDIILIWPIDWEPFASGALIFSWSSSGNFYFKIDVSADPSFSDSETLTFPEEDWITALSLWLRPEEWETVLRRAQESEGQLFWRIRAKSQDGRVFSSNWQRFIVENNRLPEE